MTEPESSPHMPRPALFAGKKGHRCFPPYVSCRAISIAIYLIAASITLSWVALYNGAPLVFADTMSYLTSAYRHEVPGLFSIFYSLFILPFHWGMSFWPVVLVQGALLAHILQLTARAVSGRRIETLEMLLIVGALSVFSSLPWITGQILPDVFTPMVLLCIFLLTFVEAELSGAEIFYVGAVTVLAITTHLSHVPIAGGLILLAIVVKFFFWRAQFHVVKLSLRLGLPICIALALMVGVNWLSSREVTLSRNSNVFLLAKWIDEGPALSYLREACPEVGYAVCRQLKDLEGKTHDDLKWGNDSPFKKIGTFDELEPEARLIVRATIRKYPYAIVRQAFIDVGIQLSRFQAGDGLSRQFARMVAKHVGAIFGTAVGSTFLETKQELGQLPVTEFRRLHLIGLGIATGVCFASIFLGRDALPRKLQVLLSFVVLGIAWNAIVTGALSGPYDRYLARVVWLICFIALLMARAAVTEKRIPTIHRSNSGGLNQSDPAR